MKLTIPQSLTLKDKLSRLSFVQAQKLLGPEGAHWLAMGGKMEIDTAAQVRLTEDSCQVTFADADARIGDKRDPLVVRVALHPGYRYRLQIGCNRPGDEALLGAKPEGPPDVSMQQRAEAEAAVLVLRKERVSEAGGHLLAAAFSFLGEILPAATSAKSAAPAPQAVSALRAGLQECVETGADGKLRLAVTLPGMQSLDALASALAKLMAAREGGAASLRDNDLPGR